MLTEILVLDMKDFLGKCLNPSLAGRSVYITCQDRVKTVTVTASSTTAQGPETKTLMLYPYSRPSDCPPCREL